MVRRRDSEIHTSYRVYELILSSVDSSSTQLDINKRLDHLFKFLEKEGPELDRSGFHVTKKSVSDFQRYKERIDHFSGLSFSDKVEESLVDLHNTVFSDWMKNRCKVLSEFSGIEKNHRTGLCQLHLPSEISTEKPLGWSDGCRKELDCPNKGTEILEDTNQILTFGKFDIAFLVPLPHAYWSNLFRTEFSEECVALGDFLSIPTSRVNWCNRIKNNNIERYHRVFPKTKKDALPIVAWTFITFPETVSKTCRKKGSKFCKSSPPFNIRLCKRRGKHLLEMTNFIVGSGKDGEYKPKQKSVRRLWPKSDIEMFLSYSTHFPVLLKAQFENFSQLDDYLNLLRESPLISDTSTVLGVRKSSLWNATTSDEDTTPITTGVLIKSSCDDDSELAKRIKSAYDDQKKKSDEALEIYHRGYYWDLFAIAKNADISATSKFVIDHLNQNIKHDPVLNNVHGTVTIPFWDIENEQTEQRRARPKYPNWCDTPSIPRPLFVANRQNSELYASCRLMFPLKWKSVSSEPPISNLLLRRFYNLKTDFEWLVGQTRQLGKGWMAQLKRGGLIFFRLTNEIENELLKEMVSLGEIIDDYLELSTLVSDSKQLTECGNLLWDVLHQYELLIQCQRTWLHYLRAEFNERTEALQAVTMTEPHIRFGERSGVTDMIHAAAYELLSDYAGKWDFEYNGTGNRQPVQIWRGVVASSREPSDFWISTPIQLLCLPSEFKANVHRRLPPLAHEAAHLLLYNVLSHDTSYANLDLHRIWSEVCRKCVSLTANVLQKFPSYTPGSPQHFNVVRELLESLQAQFVATKQFAGSISLENLTVLGNTELLNIIDSEILVDILGFLSGGPAVVASIAELGYVPGGTHDSTHPPVWLRVFVGLELFRHLGLGASHLPWLYRDFWRNRENRNFGIFESIMSHEKQAGESTSNYIQFLRNGTIDSSLFKEIGALFKLAKDGYVDYTHPLLNEKIYIVSALMSAECSLLDEVIEWCIRHSDGFLFYKTTSPKLTRYRIRKVTKHVEKTALEILYNGKVAIDSPPRYISAASMHPVIRRPIYPSGALIHSLYYTWASGNSP